MRLQSRLLRLSGLLPAALVLGLGAGAVAQDSHAGMKMPDSAPSSAAKQSPWSDPASWPDGKVPREGDAVTIGKEMVPGAAQEWVLEQAESELIAEALS